MADELYQLGAGGIGKASDDSTAEPVAGASSGGIAEPVHEEPVAPGTSGMINIRNLSVKCGHCGQYQTLMTFSQTGDGWNVYTYECEDQVCDPELSRTHLELPHDLDEYAHRDPGWKGGAIHAGGD